MIFGVSMLVYAAARVPFIVRYYHEHGYLSLSDILAVFMCAMAAVLFCGASFLIWRWRWRLALTLVGVAVAVFVLVFAGGLLLGLLAALPWE